MKKKLYIKTYGCQMNVYDSGRMRDLMVKQGYETVEKPDNADLIILNTCHIREKPTEKIFSELGKLRQFKNKKTEQGGYMVIVVAGCVAQAEGVEIIKRMNLVDIVIGTESYHKLPEMVADVLNKQHQKRTKKEVDDGFKTKTSRTQNKKERREERTKMVSLEITPKEKFASLPENMCENEVTAFLTIQEGCNKFCSYCVVPYTRGREYSRPYSEIETEAKNLVKHGVKEITLLGQNVDSYKDTDVSGNKINLAKVIKGLAKIEGLERIRYMTSYPNEIDDELIEAHRDIPKLMPFIHLPMQSGSDKVLKSMNRRYTTKEYIEIVAKLRKARPDIAISSDFIIGFAGETEKDFQDTFNLVDKIKFAQSFSFKYSVRPNTPGAKMKNQISEEVKTDRLNRFQTLTDKQQTEFNKQLKGKTTQVLVENTLEKINGLFGKTPYLQSVKVEIPDSKNLNSYIGKIINVCIKHTSIKTLIGEIIE
jgi:tRNA-2-methylthio-N6-dimethylallyladenosine synthase